MHQVEALFKDTVVDLALVTRALRQLDKDFQPAAIPGGFYTVISAAVLSFASKRRNSWPRDMLPEVDHTVHERLTRQACCWTLANPAHAGSSDQQTRRDHPAVQVSVPTTPSTQPRAFSLQRWRLWSSRVFR